MFEFTNIPFFPDYDLIDSGNFKKLERFGSFILSRPEPQAIWSAALTESDWQTQAHAWFERTKAEEGSWKLAPGMPEQWWITYGYQGIQIKMRLGLTSFKHVGVFPEQADNWNFIVDSVKRIGQATVLNLFAYTGAASIMAKAAGADVVHVDAVKPVVTWARQNMEASKIDGVRWVVEDATKFVEREVKRQKKYQGIILDPPAYGRGPNGEKWLLEKDLEHMLFLCSQLLENNRSFLVLNLYSMGFSSLIAENLIKQYFPHADQYVFGELFAPDNRGFKLPLGVYWRGWV